MSCLNPFSEDFVLKGVLEFLSNIVSYINPFSDNFLGKKIMELLGDLLKSLFIPKQESFEKFQNVFQEKLGFIDSIKTGINSIKNMVNNIGSAPKFTIDMDNKWYKGEITVIDLSWYAQYKNYGDLVFTGFAYMFFFFTLFKHIPDILSGTGSAAEGVVSSISKNSSKN